MSSNMFLIKKNNSRKRGNRFNQVTMQYNGNNEIQTSMLLQNRITASQLRVKMEAFAIIQQLDTHAAARMATLGTIAIVNIIAIMFI